MIDQQLAPSCEHGELAVGWALHALEPAEEILVAEHLPDCAECTRTVADAELVGATLGLSVPQQTPSSALEQRIRSITSTAQVPRAPAPEDSAQQDSVPGDSAQRDSVPGDSVPGDSTQPARMEQVPPPRAPRPVPRETPRPPQSMASSLLEWLRRRGSRREPLCIPDIIKLLAVAVLVFAVAVVMVYYVLP